MAESKLKESPKCLKCGSDMESGFILDLGHSAIYQGQWMEGEAEPADKTFGFIDSGGVKIKGHTRYAVTTYRCKECGFLESYANQKIQGDRWAGHSLR